MKHSFCACSGTPTALRKVAQGCRAREASPGGRPLYHPASERLSSWIGEVDAGPFPPMAPPAAAGSPLVDLASHACRFPGVAAPARAFTATLGYYPPPLWGEGRRVL